MGILSAFRFTFQNLFFTPVLYGVIASLAIFSATWEKGDRLKDRMMDTYRSQQDTFDFIIVGGGSAGAVLAYRLSKYHTVLLLEAGGESHPFQAIPALSLFIPNYPATDWSHKSVKQSGVCLACKDQRFTFSQGKNLGGSGNLNYLIHLRGNPKDFDNWARITGDEGWSYGQVLSHFTRSEHFVGATTDPESHGAGGPMQVEMPHEIGLANEWNWGGQEMGYKHLDLNGKYEEGFDAIYYPIRKGVRQATYRAFIQPVRHRGSLVIRKFAHVNKVLIREGTKDAYGVVYDRHGKSGQYAFANKEVILSAGTLQTPKLLMLSGIGPKEVLEGCGIPVVSDLPVGKGLHDHISTLVGPFFINSKKTFSYDDDVTANSFLQFMNFGTGPLTTSGFQATALLTSGQAKAKGQAGWPDLQLILFGVSPHRMFSSDLAHAFGLKPLLLQRFFLSAQRKSAFFILVSVARPESRGQVKIAGNDPYKPLIIEPCYYSDPTGKDMKVMLEGIERALYLAENTTSFRSCQTRLADKCFPGCEKHAFRSEGYWECYARHMSLTLNDHVGTAQMGYRSSPYAVVDSELKVMGVNGLRVVDASVMPTIPGANTQAATIMVAEKAAVGILRDWKDSAVNFDLGQGKGLGQGVKYGPPPLPDSQYGPPQTPLEEYGPPKDENKEPKPEYGPPPGNQYGAPPPENVKGGSGVVVDDSLGSLTPPGLPGLDVHTQPQGNNGVVVDDSLDQLTPPGLPGPDHPQGSYDSLDILRGKGISSLEGINLEAGNVTETTLPIPEGFDTSGFTTPAPATDLTPPPLEEGQEGQGHDPSVFFTTPSLYQEVYDPSTTPSSATSYFTITKGREGKLLEFGEEAEEFPDNILEATGTTPLSLTSSTLYFRKKGGLVTVPKVTVNPRGHLGLEEEGREAVTKTTTQDPSGSSTSVQPLPPAVRVRSRVRARARERGGMRFRVRERERTGTTPMPSIDNPVEAKRLRNFIPPRRNEEGEEAIVLEDVDIESKSKLTKRTGQFVEEEEEEEHPLVPLDLDPVPNIMVPEHEGRSSPEIRNNNSSSNSSKSISGSLRFSNLRERMAKFVRRRDT